MAECRIPVPPRSAATRAPGQREFSPDGLAMRSLAGPPALGELRDQEQAASTLVEGEGPAEVRGGTAAVGDLADERLVPDETELDRARSVPDRVSHQFADHEPGDEGRVAEPPAGEPHFYLLTGVGDNSRIRRQIPHGDP